MLSWAVTVVSSTLAVLLFRWMLKVGEGRGEALLTSVAVGMTGFLLVLWPGLLLARALDGIAASGLQERELDFDTVPVCFRTSEVAPLHSNPHETVPKGLFCCRQAGDLSCVIDWRAPRLGIDD